MTLFCPRLRKPNWLGLCVCVCVWVCLKNRATDIDLCLVEQIKLFPHACTHFSMAECASVCSEHVFVWGLFVCVCVRARHGILIPGPNRVILRLSYSVKCSWHCFLNSLHSLVASDVNPDTHKRHLRKWHLIHYTRLHTHKKRRIQPTLPAHTNTAISGVVPKLNFSYNCPVYYNILFCCCRCSRHYPIHHH